MDKDELQLLRHKWQHRVLEIEDMLQLVDSGEITKEDFFDITRCSYQGIYIAKKFEDQFDF